MKKAIHVRIEQCALVLLKHFENVTKLMSYASIIVTITTLRLVVGVKSDQPGGIITHAT